MASTHTPPFHHAFPVHDLDAARAFYRDILGCEEGRSSHTWIDYNLYGSQVSIAIVRIICGRSQNQRPIFRRLFATG